MTKKENTNGSDGAKRDLEEVERLGAAARRRGTFPLSVAALASAWIGLMTVMVLDDYEHMIWFLLMGVILLIGYRQKRGAWVLEFEGRKSPGQIFLRLLGGAAILGGGIFLAKTYPVTWAPKAIGAAIGLYIFALMYFAHRKTWAELKKGEK